MRVTYKVLAYLVAGLVVVQAMAIVYAISGMSKWVEGGGVLDAATMADQSATPFPEVSGFAIHGMNGMMVIPIVALLLLVASFFAKVPGASLWALSIVALVALQITLGFVSFSAPWAGALHGLNALALFSVAIMAGRRVRSVAVAQPVAA